MTATLLGMLDHEHLSVKAPGVAEQAVVDLHWLSVIKYIYAGHSV
jgi:hypothetical protein